MMVGNSFLNCHAKGCHSIVISQSPTIRVFITDETHELYRNLPEHVNTDPQAVAFHPHHCDLTLAVWQGLVVNWRMSVSPFQSGRYVGMYNYQCPALGCGTKFTRIGDAFLEEEGVYRMEDGDSQHLLATDLHTVGVFPKDIVAWFVFEGRENPLYDPIAYSNADLTQFDPAGLYVRPTEDQVKRLLQSVDLL